MTYTTTKRERDVAALWGLGKIKFTEVQKKLKKQPASAYITLARALKELHYPKQ